MTVGIPMAVVMYARIADAIFELTMWCVLRGGKDAEFKKVFRGLAGAKGVIPRQRLEESLHHFGIPPVPAHRVKRMLDEADENHDGVYEEHEFATVAVRLHIPIAGLARQHFKLTLQSLARLPRAPSHCSHYVYKCPGFPIVDALCFPFSLTTIGLRYNPTEGW